MESVEFVVSAKTMTRIFVFILYVPICLFVYWRLIPRLSPTSKRLASFMLVAQVTVIVVSLEMQSYSSIERWLWDIKTEWNIPATLASTQLALVAGVALLTAWLARVRPAWQRFYLVATGLVFLFLALDEYLTLHEGTPNWERNYTALGALVVVATVLVAVRSPRRAWIWHLCLLTGLAMSAAGGILLELLPTIRGNFGLLYFDKSLQSFHWEEFFEFLGIWLVLVAILGQFSEVAPTPPPRVQRLLYTLPALWILLVFLNSLIPRLELRLLAQPATVKFESGVHLRGYRIDNKPGASLYGFYVSARRWKYRGLGYSVHLVDQASGDSVASRNEWADPQSGFWLLAPTDSPVFRHWMEVDIPPQTQVNRALWVVLTLWREQEGEYQRQAVVASDLQLLNDTQVVLGELVLPAMPAASPTAQVAIFDNGFTLEAVDMPEHAQPGETLTIPIRWRSDADGSEDYVQFLHFVHQESGALWNHDQQPLGARLPSRLWYSGLADTETWQVPLPADLSPGRYSVFTGLYSPSDLQRVPTTDADGTSFVDARISLGDLTIGSN